MVFPRSYAGGVGLLTGAFVSFFAYIGFETMATMAEETHEVERTVPRAILLAIGLATVLYALVALVAVASVPPRDLAISTRALCLILEANGWRCGPEFGVVALLATLNGVLLEILMLGRLLYGMARRGWAPGALGTVSKRTRVPVLATVLAGGVILILTVMVDFARLIALTSTVTLGVFFVVNLGLWRLKRRFPGRDVPLRVSNWCPLAAALACLVLLAGDFVG
jgi:amino acid transporter